MEIDVRELDHEAVGSSMGLPAKTTRSDIADADNQAVSGVARELAFFEQLPCLLVRENIPALENCTVK